jgi:asparagine synthase (glutamine-hydrolysing)
MCGLAGIARVDGEPIAEQSIATMTRTLTHRGPDSDGIWTEGPIALGHRRLAIIDLTSAAHQPMESDNGDVVLVYNGELYNHQELRVELEALGHFYRSRSDTETIVHAYEQWGIDCLSRFNGMFALAIWDRPRRRLLLARDRFGVKPLYYHWDGCRLAFASEIKAILTCPHVRRRVNPTALNEYFTFQNILTDQTLFEGVCLLSAGHWVALDLQTAQLNRQQYWDFPTDRPDESMSMQDTVDEVYRLFDQSVRRQLMSDVPIGSYLSGGMDSGSIVAVASSQLGRMSTFTVGFDLSSASGIELGFDERANSELLANEFKTEHYEVVLHAGDMQEVMPELIWHLEDLRVGQCYPNYYASKLAGKFVKVVLSGSGGDELFGGYPWRYYRALNSTSREDYYHQYYNFWQRLVPDEDKPRLFTPSLFADVGEHSTFDVFRGVFGSAMPLESVQDFVNASLYFELKTFLPGILLVEDKVSMAHSLETRVPFLDNDLVDFSTRIPAQYKLRNLDQAVSVVDEDEVGKRLRYGLQNQDGKLVLREAMARLIPADVIARAKQGFSAPDASWFRGQSIEYINGLLRQPNARINDVLQPEYVNQVLDEHCSGRVNRRLLIWSFLSLEWWLRTFF